MSSKIFVLLLTFLVTNILAEENSEDSGFWVVSTSQRPSSQQNSNNSCIASLEEKIKFHDVQLKELESKLQTTQNELMSLANKQQEHKVFAPEDCKEVLRRGYIASGMYKIKPVYSPEEFWVWCDLTKRGGGWIYVLNRFDGSEIFYRNWTDYKEGFGNVSGEFWLGLEHLHHLTNSKSHELLFELVDWNVTTAYAKYDKFVIGSEAEGYNVKILGKFSGDAGDSFSGHAKMKFSTPDRDQDTDKQRNCAAIKKAGWWYIDCFFCQLTTIYLSHGLLLPHEKSDKISWRTFHGDRYSLKQAKMMVRPTD